MPALLEVGTSVSVALRFTCCSLLPSSSIVRVAVPAPFPDVCWCCTVWSAVAAASPWGYCYGTLLTMRGMTSECCFEVHATVCDDGEYYADFVPPCLDALCYIVTKLCLLPMPAAPNGNLHAQTFVGLMFVVLQNHFPVHADVRCGQITSCSEIVCHYGTL